MKISEEKINDVVICHLEGEITIDNSPELRKHFDGLIKKDAKKIIVDFSNVAYIDSSGLATLIEMYQRLQKIGGKLRFSSMTQKIKSIFELTRLQRLFEILDSKESALKDF